MPNHTTLATPPRWDIFCQVIDNFGDIGVCWRLAAELAARGIYVTLRIDDDSALAWMAPQGHQQVRTLPFDAPYDTNPDVVIEAFGCEAPSTYLQALAHRHTECASTQQPKPVLINLEYLSAEDYVERCHQLPSRIMSGPANGMTRWFFYPGFTPNTGGLIREVDLAARQTSFDRRAWRAAHGVTPQACAISLFCYEPLALPQLLSQLSAPTDGFQPRLLVTPGRATAAVKAHTIHSHLRPIYLPTRTQTEFDEMLWACDLNLVRGEDSLVRALWAGQPFVWHIYPQHDNAHHAKLNAFLDWLQAPASLRTFHHAWNGMSAVETLPHLTPEMLAQWHKCTLQAREKLQSQPDLIAQLQPFATEKS